MAAAIYGVDVAAPDAVIDLGCRGGVIEAVGAGLQGSVLPETSQVEGQLAADDPRPGKLAPDTDGR
jgi:hypothetical protein